jgi:septal ring factor EnvC (AmiA/AmiB activator)
MIHLNFRQSGLLSALVIALLGNLQLSYAETPDATAAQLGQVEQNLQDSANKQSTIAADIEAAIKAQSEITEKLIALAETMNGQQQAMAKADKRIKKLESEAIIIRSDLAEKQDVLSELLAGLQRLEQNPPPALVVEPGDVLQALRGAMMFGAVVPDLRAQADSLQSKLERLAAIKTETEAEKQNQQATLLALQTSQSELTALQEQKKSLALTATKDLEAEKQHADALAKEAKTLKQLLASLEAARLEDERQKTAEAKARDEAEKLKQAALLHPPMIFSKSKGKLEYPVQGDILKQFGDDNGLGATLDGTAVATNAGLNVTSPIDGKVEFAGSFRSYGQLLILNAGEGYLVLLAGMKQISTEIGQSVKAGEPVGTMGAGPSSLTLIGGEMEKARPVLYIEFRKNSEPVDPSPWWVGGRKEAMK